MANHFSLFCVLSVSFRQNFLFSSKPSCFHHFIGIIFIYNKIPAFLPTAFKVWGRFWTTWRSKSCRFDYTLSCM
jgi:hypothetical protein